MNCITITFVTQSPPSVVWHTLSICKWFRERKKTIGKHAVGENDSSCAPTNVPFQKLHQAYLSTIHANMFPAWTDIYHVFTLDAHIALRTDTWTPENTVRRLLHKDLRRLPNSTTYSAQKIRLTLACPYWISSRSQRLLLHYGRHHCDDLTDIHRSGYFGKRWEGQLALSGISSM